MPLMNFQKETAQKNDEYIRIKDIVVKQLKIDAENRECEYNKKVSVGQF